MVHVFIAYDDHSTEVQHHKSMARALSVIVEQYNNKRRRSSRDTTPQIVSINIVEVKRVPDPT